MKTFIKTNTYAYWFVLVVMVLGLSSCSSYRTATVEDGIYGTPEREVIVEREVVKKDVTKKQDNYFAKELDKYERLNDEEVLVDIDEYSSDQEYGDEDDEYKGNSYWGDDVEDVNITYHINYGWSHPYRSYGYYGYNWGYNWYYPNYYYRPWYRPFISINFGYYNPYYYNPYYYSPYYYGYYSPYYYGYGSYYSPYGYYNPYYYGGYGYGYYNRRAYDRYGRRTVNAAGFGRASMSRSVAVNTNNNRRSIIKGSGAIKRPSLIARDKNSRSGISMDRKRDFSDRRNPSIRKNGHARDARPTAKDRSGVQRTRPSINKGRPAGTTRPSVRTRPNTRVRPSKGTTPKVQKPPKRRASRSNKSYKRSRSNNRSSSVNRSGSSRSSSANRSSSGRSSSGRNSSGRRSGR